MGNMGVGRRGVMQQMGPPENIFPRLTPAPAEFVADCSGQPWRLLLVEDSIVVYEAFQYALADARIDGRPLQLLHTFGAPGSESRPAHDWHAGRKWLPVPATGSSSGVAYLEVHPDFEGGPAFFDALAALVTAAFRAASLFTQLRSLAHYDPLCRLPNRAMFITLLDAALCEGRDWVVAVLDIDYFSSVTNALGYRLGDALLRGVAARLKAALGPQGFRLARINTDNFAILAPAGLFDVGRILALFVEPVEVESYRLPVSVTIGLTHAGDLPGRGEAVLKGASTALKLAKQQARGSFRSFAPAMAADVEERIRLLHDLKLALSRDGLEVHYQPQVDLVSGRAVGVEALVRWPHPELGMIPPDRFIGIAERSGLIVELGEFVLRRACRDMVELRTLGLPPLRLAVNVSMNQFRCTRFVPMLAGTIAETGINPAMLELEITESMVMSDVQTVVATLNAIKALGVMVALDDFGTGFSSLSYLRLLPIDQLKVDRSFVREVGTGNSGARIARMIVSLGETLGMRLIGEGIESAQEAEILREWGCREGQGYHFAYPMDRAALRAWLEAENAVAKVAAMP